jgi:uncharacterized CHY-type Zn-finger protein
MNNSISDFKDELALKLFGTSLTETQNQLICIFCGKSAKNFRDELSRKEYKISGLCQVCQDEVFNSEKREIE